MPKKKSTDTNKPSYSNRNLQDNDKKRVARGEDMYGYGEQKKKINLTLTPSAIANLTEVAKQVGLSRSETAERVFRNPIKSLVSLVKD